MGIRDDNPLVVGFFSVFCVPSRKTVVEWADTERILSAESTARSGKYRSSVTPFMRQPMNDLSVQSRVQEVVMMAGAQVGKSESGNNWVGYVVKEAPGPMLLVQPTVDTAKRYSKQRITPMFRDCETLAKLVVDNKSRSKGNTIHEKEFPGGILILGGANSAAGLRSMPIRYLFADEISNWPADVDGEGDPLKLAAARTDSFGSWKKIFKCSTPKLQGFCRIEKEYLSTDQRKYHVPCPECGHKHELVWENFKIPLDKKGRHDTLKAYMVCPDCGGVIQEHHKTKMLEQGEWVATCPDNASPIKVGYHISALYSPIGWKSWAECAKQWTEAQDSPTDMQTFYNNVLALTWKVQAESFDPDSLIARAVKDAFWKDTLPDGVLVLGAGIDCQMNRVEIEVLGMGVGGETWSIDYHVIYGDTQGAEIWKELDLYLQRTYRHPCGIVLQVARAGIDTGGGEGMTSSIYKYVKSRFGKIPVIACKGRSGDGLPIVGTPTRSNIEKIDLYPVGTFTAKDLIFAQLKVLEPGPGYCHFALPHNNEHYFKMLTAEEVRTKINPKGFPVREWHKTGRNEALDCRAYALAAIESMQLNFEQLAEIINGTWLAPPPQERRVRAELEVA